MTIFWITLLIILLLFEFVVLFLGAPYIRTLRKQRDNALDLLDLKTGQHFIDLGCGDGVMLKAAAERGLKATGYELNPLLVFVAWLKTRRYNGAVRIVWGSFWKKSLDKPDGIFVFLTEPYMKKLDQFIKKQPAAKTLKLASYGFPIPNKKPAAKKGGVFLYIYKKA